MKSLRTGLVGIVVALVSIILVLGGLSLALTEGGLTELSFRPTTLPPSATPYLTATTLPGTPSPTPRPNPPTSTPTPLIVPTASCQNQPKSWVQHDIQDGDTLASIASLYAIQVEQLMQANCIDIASFPLSVGTYIYVPPAVPSPTYTETNQPTPTETQSGQVIILTTTVDTHPCGPPPGWVLYVVQKDDTLFRLSQILGVSVYQLQQANCLGNSSIIRLGSSIYVPKLPPSSTPHPTLTSTLRPTSTVTFTPIPTHTPTVTLLPTSTVTATPTFTQPATGTSTETVTPTGTLLAYPS